MIASDDSGPYREALAGIAAALPSRLRLPELLVDRDREVISAIMAIDSRPQTAPILLTLGARATELGSKSTHTTVACMVLRSSLPAGASRQYAVALGHPVDAQLAWIRRLLPKAKRLLVIYNPAENADHVERIKLAATRAGFNLILRPAQEATRLPEILETSGDAADALWGLPDSLLNASTARALLTFSYRNKIPMIAPAENWVTAGALFALTWNFTDLGQQCAETALQLAQGNPPAQSVASPRQAPYVLNRRAIEHFQLRLPEALIKGARRVHE